MPGGSDSLRPPSSGAGDAATQEINGRPLGSFPDSGPRIDATAARCPG